MSTVAVFAKRITDAVAPAAPTPRATLSASPLAWVAAAFACGILIEHVAQSVAREKVLWAADVTGVVMGAFVFGSLACGVWCFARGRYRVATACLLSAFTLTGACFARYERQDIAANRVRKFYDEGRIAAGTPVEVTGVMLCAAEAMPDGFALRLRVESLRYSEREQAASGRVRLFAQVASRAALAAYNQLELRHGARIRVTCVLRRMEAFRNPGVVSQVELLDRAGFDASGGIKSPLLIERLDDERIFLPLWWLYRWRAQVLTRVHATFEPHTAGLLGAMLLGNDFFLTRDVGERFRIGGTYHVLVISGMHITIIGFIALLIVRRFSANPLTQFCFTIAAVWGYAIAVGAETSVVRAALMFTLLVLAPVMARPVDALNALGGAALLLLAWQPRDLFNPSFQLTFVSVLSITTLALPLLAKLRATGVWRPAAAAPYPPACRAWWRTLGEILFWNERRWQEEMRHSLVTYKLRKARAASWLHRYRLQLPLRYAFTVIVVSACVQIVMLPLLVIHFHRISLVALLLNLVVGVLMTCVTVSAVLAVALGEVSSALALPFVLLTQALNAVMVHSVDPFTSSRAASFRVPAYSGVGRILYALYYLPLAVLLVALWRWRPLARLLIIQNVEARRWKLSAAWLMLATLSVIILAHPRSETTQEPRLRIDFIDVGQGDAALVTLPDSTTLLIDGGGRRAIIENRNSKARDSQASGRDDEIGAQYDRRTIGEMVVSEYLWWRGLDHVDYLLATHADTDHIEGLNAVARNFRPRAALIGRTDAQANNRDPDYIEFMQTLAARRIPTHNIAAGDVMRVGGATLEVLHPPASGMTRSISSSNNNSVVINLSYGKRRFLFTGDIERAAETTLVSDERKRLAADVIKVAHHGSRTSSMDEFVRESHPAFAVISVGRESPFNHPHTEVVERWRASGARVLTTGESGTITISTNGEDLRIETFVKNSDE